MRLQLAFLTAVVMLAAALAASGTASAANGTTQVDGVQTVVSLGDPFDPTDDVYWNDGYGGGAPALIGFWYTRTFDVGVFTPSGVLTGTGTEEFVGCLDSDGNRACDAAEPEGSLWFAFESSAKYDPFTFAQFHGRCHHVITSGTGGFAGATGQVRYKDDPENGCSYYSGHVTLGG
jgi:hypothetical protein